MEPAVSRIAIYARVSTLTGQNPEMQLAEIREYASRRGWSVAGEYVDIGVSGSKESRPELNRLMRDGHAEGLRAVREGSTRSRRKGLARDEP